ncbi:MAG TPA: phytanoyl-CoA dioxygenase family protein [Caldilineaceae bacterium]|nr:phytanoyl-CoA dioxygenase family protein [Caldilineaceae bacterium]
MSFDRRFWDENGYVIIPNAVPPEQLQAVIDSIWQYTGKDPNNSESWYQAPLLEGAMVNMSHSQSMWDNRQSPLLHEVFTELWGTEKLWVVLDRVNMNPPVRSGWDHSGFLHWDMDPTKAPEPMFQAVLYLTDTTAEMGGFQCAPGSHHRLLEWQATHSPEEGAPREDTTGDWMMKKSHPIKDWVMQGLETKAIEGKAGDFLIWNVALLHGNGRNVSDRPRLAQYISLTPEGTTRANNLVHGGEELRKARIDSWQNGAYPGVVAAALGVPEGVASVWLNGILADPAKVCPIPEARCMPRLTADQLAALPGLLAQAQPWLHPDVAHAIPLHKSYGIGGRFLAAELLSREIADLLYTTFGFAFTAEPAQLTPLGEKLLGRQRW